MKAQCLCGAVKFDGQLADDAIQACHCNQCQRWTGGGPLLVTRVTDLTIEGAKHIGTYHHSDHGERAFCKTCGSSLPAMSSTGRFWVVPAGTLTDDPGMQPQRNIFWASRAPWFVPTAELPHHDELPPR